MTNNETIRQTYKDAPRNYGVHPVEYLPYSEYHPLLQNFFNLLSREKPPIKILDAACGNENGVMDGMNYYKGKIQLTSVDLLLPVDLVKPAPNVSRNTLQCDLRQNWPFPDNYFHGVIFMWAIHWFGLEGSIKALDNIARVLKTGGYSIISTLTPYDVLLKNNVFYTNKITKEELKKNYPEGKITIGSNNITHREIYVVDNEKGVDIQLKENGGKYYLKHSNPASIIGEKSLIGFMPEYLEEELKKRGLEIINRCVQPNKSFPNEYPVTTLKGTTQLIYVVRKN